MKTSARAGDYTVPRESPSGKPWEDLELEPRSEHGSLPRAPEIAPLIALGPTFLFFTKTTDAVVWGTSTAS